MLGGWWGSRRRVGREGVDFADSPNPAGLTVYWRLHSVHTGLHVAQSSGLDLVASLTQLAGFFRAVKEDKLGVDVGVQLLDQPLHLIQGQEVSTAHTDEGRLFRVLEMFTNESEVRQCLLSSSLDVCCWSALVYPKLSMLHVSEMKK